MMRPSVAELTLNIRGLPPPEEDCVIPQHSHVISLDRSNQPPKQRHPSVQNNSSNKLVKSFDLLHPLSSVHTAREGIHILSL